MRWITEQYNLNQKPENTYGQKMCRIEYVEEPFVEWWLVSGFSVIKHEKQRHQKYAYFEKDKIHGECRRKGICKKPYIEYVQ